MKTFFFCVWISLCLYGSEFITRESFWALSHGKWPDSEFDISHIKERAVIFVGKSWPQFVKKGRVDRTYILLSLFCYQGADVRILPLLEDEKLLFCLMENPVIQHPKIVPIPIGLPCFGKCKDLRETYQKMREMAPSIAKKHLLYLNFCVNTCPLERARALSFFEKASYAYVETRKPLEEYLYDLASSEFVLSPRGFGQDCYRTWESLYMGAIPIVKSSGLDPLFVDLPVVIVKEWEEISEEFLLKKLKEIRSQKYSLEKLDPAYWKALVEGSINRQKFLIEVP